MSRQPYSAKKGLIMRFTLSFVLPISVAISLLLAILIALMQVASATGSGEIAYEDHLNGSWNIFVLDLHTGVEHNLTRTPNNELTPAWSRDGSQIAFISETPNDMNSGLYVMSDDGSDPHQVSDANDIYRDPIWSPDGH